MKTFAPTQGDLVKLLEEAASQGCTITVHPGQHDLPLTTAMRLSLGLRPAESQILAALVRQGFATKPELHAALSCDGASTSTSSKNVAVAICGLRQKLKARGISIATIWGEGYRLAEESRDEILKLLAAATPTGNGMPTAA